MKSKKLFVQNKVKRKSVFLILGSLIFALMSFPSYAGPQSIFSSKTNPYAAVSTGNWKLEKVLGVGYWLVPLENYQMPSIDYVNAENQKLNLRQQIGRKTMVHIWGMDCAPCLSEMPDYMEFARNFERKGGRVIFITIDGNASKVEAAQRFISQTGSNRFHSYSFDMLNDFSQFRTRALPLSVIYDETGQEIGRFHSGNKLKGVFAQQFVNKLLR